MAKSKATRKAHTARSNNHPPDPRRSTTSPQATGNSSKQSAVIGLLSKPEGSTIEAVIKATGWQQHSVRGFLAGVVRKKLGLTLVSEKVNGLRVYRITQSTSPRHKSANAKLPSA